MSDKRGRLFVISGPSGAGKGTICKELLKSHDITLSISMTTRAPRDGEEHGKHYFFVTKEEFQRAIDNGEMLEYANVFGNMYGTPKDAVIKRLERGHNIILEIDVQGGLQIKKAMPDDTVLIFILPPDKQTLRQRLEGRATDADDVIEKRLSEAINEIKIIGEYDYYVVNDDLTTAVNKAQSIITAENAKVPDRVMPIVRRYE